MSPAQTNLLHPLKRRVENTLAELESSGATRAAAVTSPTSNSIAVPRAAIPSGLLSGKIRVGFDLTNLQNVPLCVGGYLQHPLPAVDGFLLAKRVAA